MAVSIIAQPFGKWEDRPVSKYIIAEAGGIQVSVINYGATVTNCMVPDKTGAVADVVLGFDTMEEYLQAGTIYAGGICGRYANRIANATFRINGSVYRLAHNNGVNCLHGGFRGFDKVYWDAQLLPANDGVTFTYTSKDGEEGFPGTLTVHVTYRVLNHSLDIEYRAVTDKSTPVNLTSHCYFNLAGRNGESILDHQLQLNASSFLEVNEDFIPTGKMADVKNTAMDFTGMRKTGQAIESINGYDHCWILDNGSELLTKAAALVHEKSGRKMTVYTTQPGIHFYSGHLLEAGIPGWTNGVVWKNFSGLCLETQHYPDSPNNSSFPNTILYPGEVYCEHTIYSFESGAQLS
jgi:aldose 1-epimerase